MSRKHFSWLLIVTVLLALAILFVPGRSGKESAFEPELLLPGLAGRINDIDFVSISKAGNETVATLRRTESGWIVEQADGYRADWSKLKGLLAALAQAEIIELKTSNPEYFERLGVEDLGSADSKSVQIELGEGAEKYALLVGQAASGVDGQYVRLVQGNQALLINQVLEVPAQTNDWLDRKLVDIAEDEVVEVTIAHPDGEQIIARKVSADDQDFELENLPAGREVQSAWSVNSLGGALSGLQLDAVKAEGDIDWSDSTQLKLLTADGVTIMADVKPSGEQTWVRFAASLYTAEAAVDEKSSEVSEEGSSETPTGSQEPADRVHDINERVRGWAYSIPEFKMQVMTKRMDDLLKPVEES